MSIKPARNGARWTKQEEDEILASIKTGLSIRTIADRKERTTGGIRSRLTQIACRFVEVDKMSVYEAAGRTRTNVSNLQAALKLKTEPPKPVEIPRIRMEFNFTHPVSRKELQEAPRKRKIAYLQTLVDQQLNLRTHADLGKTSYLWELSEETLAQQARNSNNPIVTLDEIMEAVRAKYPGCTVEKVEEWVDVPNRHAGQPPTRTLKSGIKIDWS